MVSIVDIVDIVDNDRHVYGVYNSQPDQTDPQQRLTPKTNPISVDNVYNSRSVGSPLGSPDRPDQQTNPLPDSDPQGKQTNQPAGDGNLVNFGSLHEKTKQNLGFRDCQSKQGFGNLGNLGNLGSVPVSVEDCQDCQTKTRWQSTLAVSETPINIEFFDEDYQDCQSFGNLPEGDPLGRPQAAQSEPAG
jgi:hypothetical protein